MQSWQLQEDIRNHTNQHHHDTCHQHTAEEGHVFTGGQHIGRTAEEDQSSAAQRHTDNITHACRQVGVQNRSQNVAQEAGECESRQNSDRLIRSFICQEHQTIHTHQRQD